MLDAMKSLRDEMLALKNKSEVEKTSDSTQKKSLPGPSNRTSETIQSDPSEVQPMDVDHYGPTLPPRSHPKPQPERGVPSDDHSEHSDQASDSEYYQARPKHKKHADRKKHKSKPISKKSRPSADEDELSAPSRGSNQTQQKVPPEPRPQVTSDPVFVREIDMSDLPS